MEIKQQVCTYAQDRDGSGSFRGTHRLALAGFSICCQVEAGWNAPVGELLATVAGALLLRLGAATLGGGTCPGRPYGCGGAGGP